MLCQLVCIDKRYHKINCFNLSEAQSLLKKKFFVDLISNKDFSSDFNKNANLIKFNSNNLDFSNLKSKLGYNWNPSKSNGSLISILNHNEDSGFRVSRPLFSGTLPYLSCIIFNEYSLIRNLIRPSLVVSYSNSLTAVSVKELLSSPFRIISHNLTNCLDLLASTSIYFNIAVSPLFFIKTSTLAFLPNLSNLSKLFNLSKNSIKNLENSREETYNIGSLNFVDSLSNVFKNNDFLRFSNINYLKFKYDYKNGNYLADTLVNQFSFLNLSKINMSNNKRFNSWFFSDFYLTSSLKIGAPKLLNSSITENTFPKNQHLNIFYNYILSTNSSNISSKFMALNVLNQKFNKLFFSSSMQQRLYGN